MNTIQWVATLSSGETFVEHSGDYKVIPGQRTPWVRLCQFVQEKGEHLTSLRLNYNGRTIHMPRSNFDRFGLGETNCEPDSYSLQYHIEGEIDNGDMLKQTLFVDLAAHYGEMTIHYIQDVTNGTIGWIVVSKNTERMAIVTAKD